MNKKSKKILIVGIVLFIIVTLTLTAVFVKPFTPYRYESITIYYHGEEITFREGDEKYAELKKLCKQSIGSAKGSLAYYVIDMIFVSGLRTPRTNETVEDQKRSSEMGVEIALGGQKYKKIFFTINENKDKESLFTYMTKDKNGYDGFNNIIYTFAQTKALKEQIKQYFNN